MFSKDILLESFNSLGKKENNVNWQEKERMRLFLEVLIDIRDLLEIKTRPIFKNRKNKKIKLWKNLYKKQRLT